VGWCGAFAVDEDFLLLDFVGGAGRVRRPQSDGDVVVPYINYLPLLDLEPRGLYLIWGDDFTVCVHAEYPGFVPGFETGEEAQCYEVAVA